MVGKRLVRVTVTVDRKPRGNYRPKATIEVSVKAAELETRPYIPRIRYIGPYGNDGPAEYQELLEAIKRFPEILGVEYGEYLGDKTPAGEWTGNTGIVIPSPIFTDKFRGSPTKYDHNGKAEVVNGDKKTNVEYTYSDRLCGHYVPPDSKTDEDGWHTESVSFYLLWKPGKKPDYSWEAECMIKSIREVVLRYIEEAEESGVSEPVKKEWSWPEERKKKTVSSVWI